MIYVKSILAGIAASIIFVPLYVIVVLKLLVPRSLPPQPASIPIDDVNGGGYFSSGSMVAISAWPLLLGGLLIFAAVFYWTFRKISRSAVPAR
jgi:hypothetical protein